MAKGKKIGQIDVYKKEPNHSWIWVVVGIIVCLILVGQCS